MPKIKNEVLERISGVPLTNSVKLIENVLEETLKDLGISFETFHSILLEFQDRGLIYDLNARKVAIFFMVTHEAADLFKRGGFHIN